MDTRPALPNEEEENSDVIDLDIPSASEADDEQTKPLSSAQERRLREYLEEELTQLQRHLTRRQVLAICLFVGRTDLK